MTKEELLKLKEKISKLSEEEKKLRDEYLKQIANGNILGPQVGYASIDKPNLKYYRDIPIKEINPNQTIYQLVFNQDDFEAIGYLGKNWALTDLKKTVDKCADAFYNSGIRMGDVVLMGVSNSFEAVVVLLALNKLGAVSKWFDLRASEKDIEKYANLNNCKKMVAFDMIVPKIKNIIDNTNLDKVIVMSPVESLSNFVKIAYGLKERIQKTNIDIPRDERFVKFGTFLKTGSDFSTIKCVDFDKDRPSIMIQSSGTTGKPKTIVHSDYSATQVTREIAYSDLPLGKGKKLLVALPPWIAYGLGDAIILPLALGTKVELCPNFEPDSVYKNIGKFTISFAAPFHYRYLKDNFNKLTAKQREKFKMVECLVSGGDKISVEENKEFEEVFNTVLVNGYGDNEGWGALTVNPTKYNKYGTVGITKYDETIIAYDNDNEVELPYGAIGEICSLSNTQFLGYENNDEATKEAKRKHGDGNIWLHTGDLGYIDNEGYVHLGGRARRVITRLGFKISAYTIEDNISKSPLVKECVAVSVLDDYEEHVPMVYVVPKQSDIDKEILSDEILKQCTEELKENEIPKYIRVVDELPYTQNGKYDFRLLEEIGNQFVESLNSESKKIKSLKKN